MHTVHISYTKVSPSIVDNLLKAKILWIDESIGPDTCYVVNNYIMTKTFKDRWAILVHTPWVLVLGFDEEKESAMFLLKYS